MIRQLPWPLAVACVVLPCQAQAPAQARIAVVGHVDSLSVGQQGFCGERVHVDSKAWLGILVDGDEAVWLRSRSVVNRMSVQRTCTGDHTFVPRAGQAYIVRYTTLDDACMVELFRVVRGAAPVREPIADAETQSCLFK